MYRQLLKKNWEALVIAILKTVILHVLKIIRVVALGAALVAALGLLVIEVVVMIVEAKVAVIVVVTTVVIHVAVARVALKAALPKNLLEKVKEPPFVNIRKRREINTFAGYVWSRDHRRTA
jgi:hypothetical protein